LGGDFNCSPGGPEFEVLQKESSAWTLPAGSQTKSTHRTPDGRDLDLDHLLLSGGSFTCAPQVTVVLDPRQVQAGQEASDHAAVMLDLAILHT
jgi:endonuclease/exonuclease/phosphatase family metal-dependent hydrolase